MNTLLMQHALDQAHIPIEQLDSPQVIISTRYCEEKTRSKTTWVIFFAAATSHAFELPIEIDRQMVLNLVEALCCWDVAMMEHEPVSEGTARLVKFAAGNMLPCPLKEIIDSTYG